MIEWEDNLKVGIKLIDEQHQMLIQALQDIYDACSRGEGIKQLEHTMQFVLWYVDKHFKDEEDLQLRIDYPHYKLHKKIHDKYRQEVYEMMREFSKDELNIGKLSQMIEYLLRMIKTHIRQEDVRIAAFISNNAIGIDKKGQIEDAGAIDKLTGLLNKQAFDKQAEQVLKENAEKAVAYVSLQIDGFNRVNRSYGYDIGDELIICVSGILHQFERDNIKVARVHDDEFLMLIEEGEDNSLTKIVLEKIKLQVYEGLKREESIVPLSISSGVSFYPQDATTLKALAQRANIALAMAKEEGNNQIVFFEEKMYEESIYTAKVMQLLQPYHLNDFLKVVYQPIHDVKTNKVKGCETLLRLYNEEEVISPGYFIPLAEANDLIIDIGYFCIEKACKTYKELEEKILHQIIFLLIYL